MAFDPQAATAKYIDSLGPAALQKAHDYTVGKEWMELWSLVVAGIVTWLIVRSKILDHLQARIGERRRNSGTLLIAIVYFVLSAILTLPWTAYADHFRERSYGRTNQSFADFLGQAALAAAITSLIAALFFTGVYWLMRRTGKRWWIWSSLLGFAVAVAVVPIPIERLFNTYEPVPPGAVRDAVTSMAKRAGIPPNRVYMFDGSRQSNNFTANAGGIGSTARVAISDVAFKSANLDEVRAVTGHEIGHYVLKHTWWGILFYTAAAALLFWVTDRSFRRFAKTFGSSAALDEARGLPILMFMVSLFSVLTLPVMNTFSRTLESEADLYSLRTENKPDALSTSLVKTAEYRYPRPTKVEEILFYDHPSVEARVRRAMEWKQTHPAPPEP